MRSPRLPSARPSRRTLLLAIGGILGAVLLAAIVAGPLRPQPVTGSSPVFTMTQGWTLLELQRHLEAGDVTAVTATGTPGAADARLVARLADGTLVPVLLSVAPEDAARSLAALGYGDRLTDEAWAAARAARALTTPPNDPFRTVLGYALPAAMLAAVVLLVWSAFRGGLPRRRTASFAVVMPGRREPKTTG